MTIDIESRTVYGNTLFYPLGDPAKALQRLTGKKTLSPSDMAALEALGVHCQIIHPPTKNYKFLCNTATY